MYIFSLLVKETLQFALSVAVSSYIVHKVD